jgi:hypothetical protein
MLQHDLASEREFHRNPESTSLTAILHGLKRQDVISAMENPAAAPGVSPRTMAKPPASGKTKYPHRIEACYSEVETMPSLRVNLTVNEPDSISDHGLERLDEPPSSGCQFVIDRAALSRIMDRFTSPVVRGAPSGPPGINVLPE